VKVPRSSPLVRARSRARRAVAKVVVAVSIATLAPTGAVIAAIVDRPTAPPTSCAVRDAEFAQLISQHPELSHFLENRTDPLDSTCGSASEIVRAIAQHLRGRQP
jgi:hypothetical protein